MTTEKTKQAEDVLRGVRLGLYKATNPEKVMYGITSLNLNLIPMEAVGTCAVDGTNFLYNPNFILGYTLEEKEAIRKEMNLKYPGLSSAEQKTVMDKIELMFSPKNREFLEFVVRHEVEHILYDHIGRIGSRQQQTWNQACDHRINLDYARSNWWDQANKNTKLEDVHPIFKTLCLDYKYTDKNWTADLIYEDLLKRKDKSKNKVQQQQHSGSAGQGDPQTQDPKNTGQENKEDSLKNNTLDKHQYHDGQKEQGSGVDQIIKNLLGIPDMPQESVQESKEKQKAAQQGAANLKDAFKRAAKQAGVGAGNRLLDMLEKAEPVLDWRKVLRKSLTGLVASEVDPKRIKRRMLATSLFLQQQDMLHPDLYMYAPSKKPEPVVTAYCLFDTSGSISNKERISMLSETYGIMKQYKSFKLTVGCWDAKFYQESVVEYSKKNQKELKEYKFHGGGGTDPNVVATEYLDTLDIKPTDRIIMFSDMHFCFKPDVWKKYTKQLIWVATTKNRPSDIQGNIIAYDKYN